MKKSISFFVATILIFSLFAPLLQLHSIAIGYQKTLNTKSSTINQLELILNFAEEKYSIEEKRYSGWCVTFVHQCYEAGGIDNGSADTARLAYEKFGVSTSSTNIPIGACVYFDWYDEYGVNQGHVGIYVGDGYVIHAKASANKIVKAKLSGMINAVNLTYLGWGWHGNIQPSTAVPTVSEIYEITDPNSLNIRASATQDEKSSILGTVPCGQKVTVKLYNTNKTWGYITYNGISGWICLTTWAKYIGTGTVDPGTNPPVEEPSTINDYYKLTSPDGYQTIRASDSTSSTNLGKIDIGEHTEVCVTKYNSAKTWGYITYNDISGWINLTCAERIYTGFNDYYKLTSPDGYQTIRKSYNTSTSALGTIYHNSDKTVCITKYNYNKSWGFLTYGNVSGWISLYYTQKVDTPTYTVTFKDWDGTTLKTQTVNYGSAATAPSTPTRTGYTFTGWDKAFNNITTNTTVTAMYSLSTYTVTFKNWDGTTLKTQTVYYGGAATAPSAPSRTGYTFTGWDKAFNNITTNTTVTATYSVNTYTVTFKDWNGTTLKTQTVNYGGAATAPSTPTRTGYTFTGWDKAFNNITANTTVTATYSVSTYTVIFKDWDGTTLKTQTVSYGSAATAPTLPSRAGYIFAGWATSSTADYASYQPGDSFITTSDTILYAVWDAVFDDTEEPSEEASSEEEPSEEISSEEEPSEDEPSESAPSVDESFEESAEIIYGDVNFDGVVDSLDAAQVLKHDALIITLEGDGLLAADVNADGMVDSLDAALILKFDAGLITEFNV